MTSLKHVHKTCQNCQRTLHSSKFRYVQTNNDRLDHVCLTCRAWRKEGFPSLQDVEAGEIWLKQLVEAARAEFDPELDRVQFEKLLLLLLEEDGYLNTWKEPVWLDEQLQERI